MNITFCGHRDYFYNSLLEDTLTNILNDFAQNNQTVCCFNGGYGEFDRLAYRCTRRAKLSKSNIKNYLVIPYLLNKDIQCEHDEVIYPPLENVPLKWAICHRNEWMVDNADVLICYVGHDWGGAYRTLIYAKRKNKTIINLFK